MVRLKGGHYGYLADTNGPPEGGHYGYLMVRQKGGHR